MAYRVKQAEFTAPNGVKRKFFYREDTNDWNTIVGAFEEDEYKILDQIFKDKDVLVDVGAHIGAVTLLMTTLKQDVHIHAVEPMAENFELLRRNIKANKIDQEIDIYNEAMWFYDDDKVKMYYGDSSPDGRTHKFIGSQFLTRSFQNSKLYRMVHTVSLSKFFEDNRIWRCRYMKMDCEGAEYGIFKAAPKEVLEMIDFVQGEYHNINPDEIKYPRQMLMKQCKSVFTDVTEEKEKSDIGHFEFLRKELVDADPREGK